MSFIPRIGMVGGGASTVCLLDALAQEDQLRPADLIVFEFSQQLWRGRPYQADSEFIRVNAVPHDMSVRAGDPLHLQNWLTARQVVTGTNGYRDPLAGAEFIPRAVFGDYLEQSARSSLRTLVDRGWTVRIVRQRVVSADRVGSRVRLCTADGEAFEVDHAVLSFGAGKPADAYRLAGTPGFVGEPYPTVTALRGIDPHADVAVLGAGLTAVDVVLALELRGHRGRIKLLSRRGVLPAVRQRPVAYQLQHFTPARFRSLAARGESLTLSELIAAMAEELRMAGEDIETVRREVAAVSHEDPVARLRRQLSEVDSPSLALRILQQAVPEVGPDIWTLLSEAEQATLLAAYDRTLMSLCCPMPPSNAAILLRLIETGKVELVRGVEAVRPLSGSGFTVDAAGTRFTTGVVVNAVNARKRLMSEKADTLVGSLVRAGLADLHPHGGVRVERAASRLTVGGRPQEQLHALGDPAQGSLFFTFGVQSLVDRAVNIVAALRDSWSIRPATTGHVTRESLHTSESLELV